jgi:hypothetical protein
MDIPMASSMDGEVDRSQGVISRAHKTVMGGAASPRWQDFGSRSEEEPEAVCLLDLFIVSTAYESRAQVDRPLDGHLYNSHRL